jgi:hypothetical protein
MHGHARMNSPLFIVKAHATVLREDAFMPDVWMNVDELFYTRFY